MTLKEKIEQREQAAFGLDKKPDISKEDMLPVFSVNGKTYNNKKAHKSIKKSLIISISIISALLILIYVPQIFINNKFDNSPITEQDLSAIEKRNNYVKKYGENDFDEDGLVNSEELEIGSNPYVYDTDFDGLSDSLDKKPTKPNDTLYKELKKQKVSVGTPYKIDDVIMWADNKSSLLKGGVIKSINGGYYFSDFEGWVKFPYGKYAYKYENGKHTLLEHKEKENAWKITSDCLVYVTEEKPEITNQLNLFGAKMYVGDNWFGNSLSKVLPGEGVIACINLWKEDTFIDTSTIHTADIKPIKFKDKDGIRFSSNDISLDDIISVYTMIDENRCILTSLFNDEKGESIIVVYGYTADGNLLICDVDGNNKATMIITPTCSKELTSDGEIIERQYFNFEGAGFNSKNCDTICFFAASTDSDIEYKDIFESKISEEQEEDLSNKESEEDVETEPTEQLTPENGVFTNGDKTYYYINSLPVLNSFIHLNGDKYEVCSDMDSGAFYVDENGQKLTGRFTVNGKTYMYYNEQFYRSTFLSPSNGTYLPSGATTSGAVYVNDAGSLQTGWISVGGKKYFASSSNGVIQKNCFVKDTGGRTIYLDKSGQMATNCLITIDGVEIMLDSSGKIINESYAVNVINAHFAS